MTIKEEFVKKKVFVLILILLGLITCVLTEIYVS